MLKPQSCGLARNAELLTGKAFCLDLIHFIFIALNRLYTDKNATQLRIPAPLIILPVYRSLACSQHSNIATQPHKFCHTSLLLPINALTGSWLP